MGARQPAVREHGADPHRVERLTDTLDAIARASAAMWLRSGRSFTAGERAALGVMGLKDDVDAGAAQVIGAVRRYNRPQCGDALEAKLHKVIDAYQTPRSRAPSLNSVAVGCASGK